MDLLELIQNGPPPPRGRKKKVVNTAVVRELTEADIAALWNLKDGDLKSHAKPLIRLRHRHHHLARLLAQGVRESEASLITGYGLASITILKSDPAFKELLDFYKTQKDELFIDFFEKLKALSIDTADELLSRLEREPEAFSIEDLQKILALAADRTGYGPTKGVNFTGTLGVINADRLNWIKEEVSKRQNGTVQRLGKNGSGAEMGGPVIEVALAEEAEIVEDSENGP